MPVKVRLRFGDTEIEVDGDKAFVNKQVTDFVTRFGPSARLERQDLPRAITAKAERAKPLAPAELMRLKQPKTGTEKLLVLAKYLEDQGATDFRRQDVNRVASEAKIKAIHPNYFSMAIGQGLLRTASKGRYGLTLSGEDAVSAMPAPKKPSE